MNNENNPLPVGPTETGKKLKKVKKCNCCGAIHRFVPEGAPLSTDALELYWWDCECLSTLVAGSKDAE